MKLKTFEKYNKSQRTKYFVFRDGMIVKVLVVDYTAYGKEFADAIVERMALIRQGAEVLEISTDTFDGGLSVSVGIK